MFKRWSVVRVGLPKGVWEPLRYLHEKHSVPVNVLASAWSVSDRAMERVLLAARLEYLTHGREVPMDELLEEEFKHWSEQGQR